MSKRFLILRFNIGMKKRKTTSRSIAHKHNSRENPKGKTIRRQDSTPKKLEIQPFSQVKSPRKARNSKIKREKVALLFPEEIAQPQPLASIPSIPSRQFISFRKAVEHKLRTTFVSLEVYLVIYHMLTYIDGLYGSEQTNSTNKLTNI